MVARHLLWGVVIAGLVAIPLLAAWRPPAAAAVALLVATLLIPLLTRPATAASGPRAEPIPAVPGLLGGARASVQEWAGLPETVATAQILERLTAVLELPSRWKVEALELLVLATHHLPEPERVRVLAMRVRAVQILGSMPRAELVRLQRAVIPRLPGWMRWDELQVLEEMEREPEDAREQQR